MTPTKKTVECELRALIEEPRYHQIKAFFMNVATFMGERSQETRYFEGPHDLRIEKNDTHAKIWLKKTSAAGGAPETTEIRVVPEQFASLEKLFDGLGYTTAVLWMRHRVNFEWDGIAVSMVDTKGYGYVVEMKLMSEEFCRIETLEKLREKMTLLGLKPTPKPVLHERFSYYREHWQELLAEKTKTPA